MMLLVSVVVKFSVPDIPGEALPLEFAVTLKHAVLLPGVTIADAAKPRAPRVLATLRPKLGPRREGSALLEHTEIEAMPFGSVAGAVMVTVAL